MLKPFTKRRINKLIATLLICTLAFNVSAKDADQKQDFLLDADNFKNIPRVVNGETQIKYWGNVTIQQGSLKIKAHEAVIFKGNKGISKIILTGSPVYMEKLIDVEFGKINIEAKAIDFMVQQELLLMTGNVIIKSKIQGQMQGEKITMNLKTKEIKGEKSKNSRVRLIIKPNNS